MIVKMACPDRIYTKRWDHATAQLSASHVPPKFTGNGVDAVSASIGMV